MSECLAGWPLSPKSHCENEGYNSADEQGAFYGLPYDNAEKEHQFEIDIRHLKAVNKSSQIKDEGTKSYKRPEARSTSLMTITLIQTTGDSVNQGGALLGYELDQLENPSPLETEARVRSSLPVKRSEVLWKQPLYLR
ncbi:hypothetical protein Tco_0351633 [Tanacetum coccineum]